MRRRYGRWLLYVTSGMALALWVPPAIWMMPEGEPENAKYRLELIQMGMGRGNVERMVRGTPFIALSEDEGAEQYYLVGDRWYIEVRFDANDNVASKRLTRRSGPWYLPILRPLQSWARRLHP
jgi:hypothetical protein